MAKKNKNKPAKVNAVKANKVEYITDLSTVRPTYFSPEFRQNGESCKYEWLPEKEHFEKMKWHKVFKTLETDAEMAAQFPGIWG